MQGVRVQSLARELRSYKPINIKKKKTKTGKELSEHYLVLTLVKQPMPTNMSQMNKQRTT